MATGVRNPLLRLPRSTTSKEAVFYLSFRTSGVMPCVWDGGFGPKSTKGKVLDKPAAVLTMVESFPHSPYKIYNDSNGHVRESNSRKLVRLVLHQSSSHCKS